MTDSNRDPRRPGRGPVFASVALHVVVAVAAWIAHKAAFQPIEYVAYEMEIVSFADLDALEAALAQTEDLVVEVPDPEPPAPDPEPEPEPEPDPPPPDPEPDPVVQPDPPPTREPDPPPRREPPPERPPETPPTEAPREESTAAIVARMEGLQRDFPVYYQRIQTEIARCFRPPAGVSGVTTVLRFEIQRDGSVPGRSIRVFQRSGNGGFDVSAVGAVECAGAGRFGPLPDDLPMDMLPVQFTFSPVGFRD